MSINSGGGPRFIIPTKRPERAFWSGPFTPTAAVAGKAIPLDIRLWVLFGDNTGFSATGFDSVAGPIYQEEFDIDPARGARQATYTLDGGGASVRIFVLTDQTDGWIFALGLWRNTDGLFGENPLPPHWKVRTSPQR